MSRSTSAPRLTAPCPTAAHRFAHRDRYTVLRWEKMEPLFKKIVDVKGDRDKYVELDRKDIRIEI